MLAVLTSVFAQGFGQNSTPQKKWSVIPRVGVNFSNLSGMTLMHTSLSGEKKESPKTMTDLMVGAEFDYYVHPAIEVGLGAFYSRQGCHYKNFSDSYSTNKPNTILVSGVENNNVHLQYLNIPVIGTLHISDNVSLKAGLQCGVFLAGNWVSDMSDMEVVDGISQNVITTHSDYDIGWSCADLVWSMPLGFEFEYERVLFTATYALPLTGFGKEIPAPGDLKPTKVYSGSNRVVSISVGYRF